MKKSTEKKILKAGTLLLNIISNLESEFEKVEDKISNASELWLESERGEEAQEKSDILSMQIDNVRNSFAELTEIEGFEDLEAVIENTN